MADIKPLSRSSEKWKRQSATARPEYEAGVAQTKKDWQTNTAAAASNYAEGVTAAISDNRFQKGVQNAGTNKWRNNTLSKGPARWTEGIAKSTDNYEKGFAPYQAAIENLSLPARGPKGSPQNIQRVVAVAEKLHQVKLAQNK